MEAPDFKTLDIADMFAGIAYPEDKVDIYIDAKTAYELYKLQGDAGRAVRDQDEAEGARIAEEIQDLLKRGEKSHYIVHIRDTGQDEKDAIRKAVDAKHPPKVNLFNQPEPNAEADEMYTNLMWALHVTRITAPDGRAMVAPQEGDIKALRAKAPGTELRKVEEKIQELRTGAASGFESLVMEHDFLSGASPEA